MQERSNTYVVKVTETAWEMLLSHARFLANVSVSAAERLIDTFASAMDSLAEMPDRNPWLEQDDIPLKKYRKLLFSKHYLAVYEIKSEVVYVTAAVDCRQDYTWLLN